VCSCFFDEERNAFFFAGSEREREERERAKKKKKRRERFVAFFCLVSSQINARTKLMRGQNTAGVMMLKFELHLAARAQEKRRYTRAQR
jgi:hypothetical protein